MSQPPPPHTSAQQHSSSSLPPPMKTSSNSLSSSSSLEYVKKLVSDLLPSMSSLRTVQHCSGLIFSIFTTLHSFNSIVANTQLHDEYLDWSRGIFRFSPVTEAVLVLGPLAAHMGSSVGLHIKRRLNNVIRKQDAYSKFQTLSGFALVAILPLHISMNRIIPKQPLSSSTIIPNGMNPLAWLIPSVMLLSLGLYHTIYGIKTALKLPLSTQAIIVSVSTLSLLGLAGLINLVQ